MTAQAPRVAVVGHIEWLDFAVVDHLPTAGEIVTAEQQFAVPAGGGAVAAVQLRQLAGRADFFTVVGDDELGARSARELTALHGLDVHAVARPGRAQRRAFTHLDRNAERTITVLGERLVPSGEEPLPWERLDGADAVYWTGGDAGAARAARRARVVVASGRAPEGLMAAGVLPDVVIASASDEKERAGIATLGPGPRWTVLTDGARGGSYLGSDGAGGRWEAVALPGTPVDAYGCGDSFAAGLTYGLGAGLEIGAALTLAARCGAWCLCGRGPYGNQLSAADL
ncbi:PfkB family carbohydrate kinase [Conexibacter sp. JD483]|uniref:PfkB family carbohydrate kinase n=1 Tax=unclassified Conexibacter TaxID=2627773 RepID=UPI00271A03DC|nr:MULTISPECIES: PfkB family carbohydrate kinase [unclassified Conexibacter]MDO8188377.1 PfkB family carbohydrate kinase [Conexibacter sp. CPCC 205706]MDO8201123.1 PfkB family carbohydrate kinase [Conexibacter sp. CPCC 205762]MDR9371577.1 PfkB family carbohydrate kinase [Conexibacter sp. JD483]